MFDKREPQRPILITAGGTGGHVYPGLAVARVLQSQGIPVIWMGTKAGLEARVIPAAGFEMAYLSVNGLRGKGLKTWLVAPARLLKALYQSFRILRRYRPRAVLGMGGFVAGPGGLVAALMGIPLVIHEQNAIPGLTNKLLSRFARNVLEGFPGTFERLTRNGADFPASAKTIPVGNPVRADIAALATPKERLARRWGHVHVLVFGGSLGAQALNEVVPMALSELPIDKRPEVRHQAGKGKDEATRERYQKMNVKAEVTPFIDDMAEAYEWADLVICRSGALTIAELTAAGLASILVPYPYAVDDHQRANAVFLSDAGAAILMPQQELTRDSLAGVLQTLCADRDTLLEMSNKARALARPHATAEVAAICAQLAGFDSDASRLDEADYSDLEMTTDRARNTPDVEIARSGQEDQNQRVKKGVKYEAA